LVSKGGSTHWAWVGGRDESLPLAVRKRAKEPKKKKTHRGGPCGPVNERKKKKK